MTTHTNRPHRQPRPPGSGQPASPESRGERRLVSPFRCRVWTQHSRPEEQLTEQACRSLRESIDKNGQHQPALGRPVTDDPDCDVEIICGARRHAAALALGRDILVELRVMSDAEAYVAMYEENVERKDDCPYVQGQILRRALLSGACSSQDELARAFSLSTSKVSRLLMIAQLPSIVVAAFPSPNDIREAWGMELYQIWSGADPEHALATRARALASRQPRLSAREVYELLSDTSSVDLAKRRLRRSAPILGRNGAVLFREEERQKTILFIVPKSSLSTEQLDALKQAMAHILDIPNSAATSDPSPAITPIARPRNRLPP